MDIVAAGRTCKNAERAEQKAADGSLAGGKAFFYDVEISRAAMRAENWLFLLGGADFLHGRGIDGDATAMCAAAGGTFDLAFRRAAVGGRRVKV